MRNQTSTSEAVRNAQHKDEIKQRQEQAKQQDRHAALQDANRRV